ncbi:hypothetical protein [Pedobacter sp. GR22-10]|uniref:hypothetical protein n=1 Tax=Pedobacter sp. GR22-10 TaxID=2994472 RepID=UPI00224807FC|nr:hypothetical protein [Pedobacter sp. GR22-10]MCX2433223.1 hypothetical protein [Pedobacter sp. GR22-10]
MRMLFTILFFTWAYQQSYAQTNTSITVHGDKFYPVTLTDSGWDNHMTTELSIGCFNIYTNRVWSRTIMADFMKIFNSD